MTTATWREARDVLLVNERGYSLVVTNAKRRPGAQKGFCRTCRKPFVRDPVHGWKATLVVIETTEVSIFRGEDECRLFHPECKP